MDKQELINRLNRINDLINLYSKKVAVESNSANDRASAAKEIVRLYALCWFLEQLIKNTNKGGE